MPPNDPKGDTKRCTGCKKTLLLTEFSLDRGKPKSKCKRCCRAAQRKRNADPERRKRKNEAMRKRRQDPDYSRIENLRRRWADALADNEELRAAKARLEARRREFGTTADLPLGAYERRVVFENALEKSNAKLAEFDAMNLGAPPKERTAEQKEDAEFNAELDLKEAYPGLRAMVYEIANRPKPELAPHRPTLAQELGTVFSGEPLPDDPFGREAERLREEKAEDNDRLRREYLKGG